MPRFHATLLALVAVVAAGSARVGVPLRYKSMDGNWKLQRDTGGPAPAPLPRFMPQRLDHFDGSSTATWQQAYYVNDTFWTPGSVAPVFLCVGGEGPPLDGSAVVSSVHCNDAVEMLKETGALMFALEHRYYGCWNASACPVKNLSSPGALRFHSSRQALGDIAAFVKFAQSIYRLTQKNYWVTWGGSYPGMLAGWARLKFPHLIHAAVSSSAPVRAEVDMRGYNNVVAEAYAVADEGVGGSAACQAAIKAGHQQVGAMFGSSTGRKALASLFGNSESWYEDIDNQRGFAGQGVADFPAQGNDPSCKEAMCNIKRICDAMTNVSIGSEVQRLAAVRKVQIATGIKAIANALTLQATPAPGWADGIDLWPWQTCTEFGFYQTCENGTQCFYTQGLADLDSEMNFCSSIFGIPREIVAANVDYSNAYYGADRPQGSRVLYVNGEVDPWHANSILEQPSPGLLTLYVSGASHHAWTHPSAPSDQASVKQARGSIRRVVHNFLADMSIDNHMLFA